MSGECHIVKNKCTSVFFFFFVCLKWTRNLCTDVKYENGLILKEKEKLFWMKLSEVVLVIVNGCDWPKEGE